MSSLLLPSPLDRNAPQWSRICFLLDPLSSTSTTWILMQEQVAAAPLRTWTPSICLCVFGSVQQIASLQTHPFGGTVRWRSGHDWHVFTSETLVHG